MRSVLFAGFLGALLAACGDDTSGAGGSGSTSSTSGPGGAGGAGGSGGAGGQNGCPSGLAGPALVEVPTLDGGSYCIDATEVRNADYEAWLAESPSTADQQASCSWNTTFTPVSDWPPAAAQQMLPVGFVDWCDAHAYCAGVGKALCGKIGGGPNAFGDQTDATKSAWFNACSAGGANTFPYGGEYDPTACNGMDYMAGNAIDVGTAPGCVGGYPGVYDMSGNMWEWEDSCQTEDGEMDLCRRRGGSFFSASDLMHCALGADDLRNMADDSIGFRCCAPAMN